MCASSNYNLPALTTVGEILAGGGISAAIKALRAHMANIDVLLAGIDLMAQLAANDQVWVGGWVGAVADDDGRRYAVTQIPIFCFFETQKVS